MRRRLKDGASPLYLSSHPSAICSLPGPRQFQGWLPQPRSFLLAMFVSPRWAMPGCGCKGCPHQQSLMAIGSSTSLPWPQEMAAKKCHHSPAHLERERIERQWGSGQSLPTALPQNTAFLILQSQNAAPVPSQQEGSRSSGGGPASMMCPRPLTTTSQLAPGTHIAGSY